jgi:hypothetical protein
MDEASVAGQQATQHLPGDDVWLVDRDYQEFRVGPLR